MKEELDTSLFKTLLESTNAIPWKLDWKSQKFTYIGPQIEKLLGWSQESWKTSADWAERMHPKDREKTVDYCVALSQEGIDHEADYRAPTKDGRYIWVRDVVHVIRENNETVAIVGFIFDISERKQLELELKRLNEELEKITLQDSLTCIANRRAFEQTFQDEFARFKRHEDHLSLLFIDIDYFKKFNDNYGHLEGDNCLIKTAQALKSTLNRSSDKVYRYGGEEFVVLLPETPNQGAIKVANQCRDAVIDLQIPNSGSEEHQFLSISVGVATVYGRSDETADEFKQRADDMLYKAKRNGRNKIEY